MGMNAKSKDLLAATAKPDSPDVINVDVCKSEDEKTMTDSVSLSDGSSFVESLTYLNEGNGDSQDPSTSFSKLKQSTHKKHAEVFRTDFISAMKLPDSHVLQSDDYIPLKDTWRQEWEKGVQVPVSPEKILQPSIRTKSCDDPSPSKRRRLFHWPKEMVTYDEPRKIVPPSSNLECDYNLDDADVRWLNALSRVSHLKKGEVDEITMERAITYFERKCFENMAHTVATTEGLSIEYDESTTCSICLSPDTEEVNEIVFCDACNMSAHQSCYGIVDIPDGSWLCRPCSKGIFSPRCILCSIKGGALKRVKGSFDWVHVICAWWVPEVKIEDLDNIEEISISKIPASRKSLICHLCREKTGACIQCSVKRCVKAYHVTCAVKEGLEMKTVMLQDKDDVTHLSYCSKHGGGCSPSKEHQVQQQQHQQPTPADVHNLRLEELRKLEEEFFNLVHLKLASKDLHLSKEATRRLYSYWALKRKANENSPLIPLTRVQQEKLSGKQGIVFLREQLNHEIEKFLYLRQDLERLRNLCYMITKREKVRRELHKMSQDVFYKQNEALTEEQHPTLPDTKWLQMPSSFARFLSFPHYVTEKECGIGNDGRTLSEEDGNTDNRHVAVENTPDHNGTPPTGHTVELPTNGDCLSGTELPAGNDIRPLVDASERKAAGGLKENDRLPPAADGNPKVEQSNAMELINECTPLHKCEAIKPSVKPLSAVSDRIERRRLSARLKRTHDDSPLKSEIIKSEFTCNRVTTGNPVSPASKENRDYLSMEASSSPQRITRSRLASLTSFDSNGHSPCRLRRRTTTVR